MKIVYQGSPGAYSHLAAKKIYPDGWETIKPYLRKVPDPQK